MPTDFPSTTELERLRAVIQGAVQGVGFRPFVYNLARRLGLAGSVRNTSTGLLVEVEGAGAAVDEFLQALVRDAPPPPRAEVMLVRPSPRHVWIAGYWHWQGNRYGWVRGHWMLPPRERCWSSFRASMSNETCRFYWSPTTCRCPPRRR